MFSRRRAAERLSPQNGLLPFTDGLPCLQTVFSSLMASAFHTWPPTIDCFLARGNSNAPVPASNGLFFLAGGNRCACCGELWTAILQATHGIAPPCTFMNFLQKNARQWLGAVSVAKRLTENSSNCSALECMSLLACCKNRSPGPPICLGGVTARSDDSFFALFNALAVNAMMNSHAKVATGSSPAFWATCLISR